jgi:purine-nucleoside phosphorylase
MDDSRPSPGLYQRAGETALHLRASLPKELQSPKVAIVCGSGLGGLADTINAEPRIEKAYSDVPNFPISTGKLF